MIKSWYRSTLNTNSQRQNTVIVSKAKLYHFLQSLQDKDMKNQNYSRNTRPKENSKKK